jgi:phosphoribosylformylglycinamidine cyclo-ligase
MPGMYPDGEYDLAGFAVGAVEKSEIIDGSKIVPGDVVLGLASSGAHSNGYSLIRKIIAVSKADLCADFHGRPLRDVLMEPTRIYVKPLLSVFRELPGAVKGLAHITGGGLTENVPRILREELMARIDARAWALPPLFRWLQQAGQVADEEMHRVFNCGIGMVVVVSDADAGAVEAKFAEAGETVYRIGHIDRRGQGEAQCVVG